MTKLFQTLYTVLYMYTQTARFKEFGTLVVLSSEHVVLHNDIEDVCV